MRRVLVVSSATKSTAAKNRSGVRPRGTGVETPMQINLGLETPGCDPACLQHARIMWGIRTWGWKPQAIVLRAFSTRGSRRVGTSKNWTRVWTMNMVDPWMGCHS